MNEDEQFIGDRQGLGSVEVMLNKKEHAWTGYPAFAGMTCLERRTP